MRRIHPDPTVTFLAMTITQSFWDGRRVLVTGHTGFKGGWLAVCLVELGARVVGVGLPPEGAGCFHDAVGLDRLVESHHVDLLDAGAVARVVHAVEPEVVFHLAAQALVLKGIAAPVATFATNVVGTANLLDACHRDASPSAVLVVTSDKVYANTGDGRAFTEHDELGAGDPYSASKAATELVVSSWRHTYGGAGAPALATARAGNVIGGGDVAPGRLLPDLLRSFAADEPAVLRHPSARRPWQFVLDPMTGYLAYAEALATGRTTIAPALNFGPTVDVAIRVADLADRAIRIWGRGSWVAEPGPASVEAPVLALDASLAHEQLGWRPVVPLDDAIEWTVAWERRRVEGGDLAALCQEQITVHRALGGW